MLLMAGRGMDLLGRISASVLEGAWAARARWLVPGALFALFTIYALTQTLPAQAHFYTDYNDISAEAVDQVENAHLSQRDSVRGVGAIEARQGLRQGLLRERPAAARRCHICQGSRRGK